MRRTPRAGPGLRHRRRGQPEPRAQRRRLRGCRSRHRRLAQHGKGPGRTRGSPNTGRPRQASGCTGCCRTSARHACSSRPGTFTTPSWLQRRIGYRNGTQQVFRPSAAHAARAPSPHSGRSAVLSRQTRPVREHGLAALPDHDRERGAFRRRAHDALARPQPRARASGATSTCSWFRI